jgi:uncharacterized protein (DUF58 family)
VSGAPREQSWLIDPADVSALETFLLRRMRDHTAGDHTSVYAGSGFDVMGLREWEPGDAMSAIDWAQSSLNNFSPLITRQLEQDSAATVMVAADASLSTHCGPAGAQLRTTILRCLAVLGLSAAFCQDRFGLVAFDDRCRPLGTLRPRGGKAHAMHCLSLYAQCSDGDAAGSGDLIRELESHVRTSSLLVLVSDCLLADIDDLIERFAALTGEHDVLVVIVDARPAFAVPPVSAGWLEIYDVETGETRTVSRAAAVQMLERIDEWQGAVMRHARTRGLDVVRVGAGRWQLEEALSACFARRRLQKLRG